MPDSRSPLRRHRGLTGLAAATLLITLTACGGGSDDDDDDADDDTTDTEEQTTVTTVPDDEATDEATDEAPADGGDACDIVSDEVVLEVLGFDDIPRREPHEVEGQSTSCIKGSDRTDDLSTASYVNVSLLIGGGPMVDQAAAEGDAVQVSGLGDNAVFVPSAGALSVAVGDDGYLIQVVKNGKPSDQADAVAVAEDVLG